MNLIKDPWIPVIGIDGQNKLLGLAELFNQLKEIRDLDVKPHERIALMRFLICIVQATIKPEDCQEWEQCKDQIPSSVVTYLEQWQSDPFFELFGEGDQFNFLQVPNLKKEVKEKSEKKKKNSNEEAENANDVSASKLDMMLASGNNFTLFDNGAAVKHTKRTLSSHRIALSLLTYQNFSPCGTIAACQQENNEIIVSQKVSAKDAPCTSKVHCFIKGDNLLDTLHFNILTSELVVDNYGVDDEGNPKWGKPLWEEPVRSLDDRTAIENATTTYLGRLVPISCCVRLSSNKDKNCDGIILANGLTYPAYPQFRESTITVISIKKDKKDNSEKEANIALSASLEKGLWRQLPAISIKHKKNDNDLSGPIVLNNLKDDQSCKLWAGALVTDKAKILDTLESIYDIPANMFEDTGRQVYEAGVHYAEIWAAKLSEAIKEFIQQLKREQSPREKAHFFFWGNIEQYISLLLQLVENPKSIPLDEAGKQALGETSWGKKVKATAFKAYEYVCPQQTIREIEAYTLGMKKFYENKKEKKSK